MTNLPRTDETLLTIGRVATPVADAPHTRRWTADFTDRRWNTDAAAVTIRPFGPEITGIGRHHIGTRATPPNNGGKGDHLARALIRTPVLFGGILAVTTIG